MKHTDTVGNMPDFIPPEPFVVADTRLSIAAHLDHRNRFDKARQIAQNEREIAAELERMA